MAQVMDFSKKLDLFPEFARIGETADELGLDTYVVGGYVRDLILKRTSKDIDFVCVGDGIRLAKAVAKELGKPGKVSIFKNYGTAQLKYHEYDLEFVGARKESYR